MTNGIAAFCIHVPMFDTSAPVQNRAKSRWRRACTDCASPGLSGRGIGRGYPRHPLPAPVWAEGPGATIPFMPPPERPVDLADLAERAERSALVHLPELAPS